MTLIDDAPFGAQNLPAEKWNSRPLKARRPKPPHQTVSRWTLHPEREGFSDYMARELSSDPMPKGTLPGLAVRGDIL